MQAEPSAAKRQKAVVETKMGSVAPFLRLRESYLNAYESVLEFLAPPELCCVWIIDKQSLAHLSRRDHPLWKKAVKATFRQFRSMFKFYSNPKYELCHFCKSTRDQTPGRVQIGKQLFNNICHYCWVIAEWITFAPTPSDLCMTIARDALWWNYTGGAIGRTLIDKWGLNGYDEPNWTFRRYVMHGDNIDLQGHGGVAPIFFRRWKRDSLKDILVMKPVHLEVMALSC
jgi:hypothetical protein